MRDRVRSYIVPLAPWQIGLGVVVAGIFALRFPIPGMAAGVFWSVLGLGPGKWRKGGVLLAACFVSGLLLARLVTPVAPAGVPDWIAARQKFPVRGMVESVKRVPGDRITITANHLIGPDGPLCGKLAWSVEGPQEVLLPGQEFSALLDVRPAHGLANFGLRDGTWYWTRQGVFWRAYSRGGRDGVQLLPSDVSASARRRERAREEVTVAVDPGPGQGLLLGLLLGDRSRIGHDLMRRVRRSGLAHSLALSGLHLGFAALMGQGLAWAVGMLFPWVLLRIVRPHLGVLLAGPLVFGYMWLGGWTPSLVRSGLMFGSWGVLLLMGRSRVLLDGLFLAVLMMLFYDPLCVYDTGLQLSVLAVAGIALGLGPVRDLMRNVPRRPVRIALNSVVLPVVMGMLATAATLPVLVWKFGMVSPHFWLNAVWLPVLGMVVLPLGLIGLGVSMIPGLHPVGWWGMQGAATVLEWFAGGMEMLEQSGRLDPTPLLRPGWPEWFGYWILLVGVVGLFLSRPGPSGRWREHAALVAGTALLCLGLVRQGVHEMSDEVVLTVLDTGMSQAVLLELPGDRRVLVDGGGSWRREYDMGESVVSPVLAWNHVPGNILVVLTHGDTDHYRGLLYPLAWSPAVGFVHNGFWPGGWGGDELVQIVKNRDIPIIAAHAGDEFELGRGFVLQVLHPLEDCCLAGRNNRSLVLRLVRNGHGLALIPGDVENRGIGMLLNRGADISADVLVVPHHGSRGSLNPELYAAVHPDLAVAAAGYLNGFGFPHPAVRKAFADAKIPLVTTGEQGSIRVHWDREGKMAWEAKRTR